MPKNLHTGTHIFILMEKIELDDWQKDFLAEPRSCSVSHRRQGKSYFQSYELVEFMKTAEIGKKISIISPEGSGTWERIK